MSDAEHALLAGLLQKPSRTADVSTLSAEYFSDEDARRLFGFARGYHEKRGRKNALDLPLARSLLERSSSPASGSLLGLVEEYEGYEPVSDAEFRDALEALVVDRRRAVIRSHGTRTLEAVVEGDWEEAESAMRRGLMAVRDASFEDDAPVDLRSPIVVQGERLRVQSEPEPGDAPFDVGFPRISRAVSLKRKELTILGGYTADGKTQWAKTLAYNANRNSGARVLYVSLEMTREEMLVLFVAQHAATLDPRGVDYRSIMDKCATPEDRALYLRALDDFQIKPHEDHVEISSAAGALNVWAPNRRPTMDDFCDRVRAVKQDRGLDVVVGDYLELIEPSENLGQYRLNLKRMMERAKEVAREQDVWALILHQISRKGRTEAEKRSPRHYVMQDLGESSGVERSSDTILWVYSDHVLKEDREARIGIAKARKGDVIIEGYHVMADFKKSIMAEVDFVE